MERKKRIGIINCDKTKFPNIPLMKISAWHKQKGDSVEWYNWAKGFCDPYDKVYISKVFSFSDDYSSPIYAKEIVKGGSGFAISVQDGKEKYEKGKDINLPYEIEHIYPDYELFGIKNKAYGFLTRGCPRKCKFCHVEAKEGACSYKVADLSEFWRGQKNIVLCDPNILACKEWKDLFAQLIESGAKTDFNQGLDIRLLTTEKAEMLKHIKTPSLHFAWDRYEDKEIILPKFAEFRKSTNIDERNLTVYILCGFNTTIEQDLERIYTLRDLGYSPYVMLYNKEHLSPKHKLRKIQRWVNNRYVFRSTEKFEEYKR